MAYTKLIVANIVFRFLACAATLAAALITVLAKQNRWGIEASYKMFEGLKFFVAGNFIVFAYSLLTAPLVSKLLGGSVLHFFDLMSMSLLIASATAGATIGYIGEKGNQYTGWYEVCRLYEQFCRKTGISLFFSFLGFLFFFVICAQRSLLKS